MRALPPCRGGPWSALMPPANPMPSAFSSTEKIVGGCVILVLGALLIHERYECLPHSTQQQAAQTGARTLAESLDRFRRDAGRYPTANEGFAALLHPPVDLPSWRGPYLDSPAVP